MCVCVLTVELMEVQHFRFSWYCVIEMKLQSITLHQAVSHLSQIDAHYGIRVSAMTQRYHNNKYQFH